MFGAENRVVLLEELSITPEALIVEKKVDGSYL